MSGGLVIGIGNPDCGDDAVGSLVARRLAGCVAPCITVMERSGDMLALIEDWAGYANVVLIDAAAAVVAPGTIHRIDLRRDEIPASLAPASTHAFGVAQAVGLARALNQLPARLIAYAIEGTAFLPGAPLSPAVAAAVEAVIPRVIAELTEDLAHA
jgi:hydrogenase maturation protease